MENETEWLEDANGNRCSAARIEEHSRWSAKARAAAERLRSEAWMEVEARRLRIAASRESKHGGAS